jgi:hypothetical protein
MNDILEQDWFNVWFDYYTARLIEESIYYKEV